MEKEIKAQYVQRSLTPFSTKKIHDYLRSINVTKSIVEDLHTTVVYSLGNKMNKPLILDQSKLVFVGETKLEKWNTQVGDILVLTFEDELFKMRNEYFKSMGSVESFPEYKSHMSLSYFVPLDFNEDLIGTTQIMSLTYGPETYEDVVDEWKPKRGFNI